MKYIFFLLQIIFAVNIHANDLAIEVEDIFARPSLTSSGNSAVYFSIKNNSNKDIILLSADCPAVANNVELHQTIIKEKYKGVAQMVHINQVTIPKNTRVEFKPGGLHIMLMELKRPLTIGDIFQLELKFQDLGIKTINVLVKK